MLWFLLLEPAAGSEQPSTSSEREPPARSDTRLSAVNEDDTERILEYKLDEVEEEIRELKKRIERTETELSPKQRKHKVLSEDLKTLENDIANGVDEVSNTLRSIKCSSDNTEPSSKQQGGLGAKNGRTAGNKSGDSAEGQPTGAKDDGIAAGNSLSQLSDIKLRDVENSLQKLSPDIQALIKLPWKDSFLIRPSFISINKTAFCKDIKIEIDKWNFKKDIEVVAAQLKRTDSDLAAQTLELDELKSRLNTLQTNRNDLRSKLRDLNKNRTGVQKYLPGLIIILGLFSLLIMVVVRRFSIEVQKEWVASGQVIQFMTVTIIISVILALGLAGQLKSEILGTLLGAIGGYVLSQGIGRDTAKKVKTLEERLDETIRNSKPAERSGS